MIVRESLLRDTARLVVWYPVRWFIRLMPISISFRFFRFLATLHKRISPGTLQTLRNNIQRGLPEIVDIEPVLQTYLENHYIDRLHIFTYPRLKNPAALSSLCSLEGCEHLDAVLSRNKGVIIVLGHYGPIQIPLFHLGQAGYDIIQVGLPTAEGLSWIGRHVAFRLRLKYEKMIPVRILPANEFLRPLFEHLKKNGVIMMNIDPAGGGKWLGRLSWRLFLHHWIPFPLGAIHLSRKTGAPIVPLSIHRSGKDRYLFRLHPALESGETTSPVTEMDELVAWYEDEVRQDPGLWHFWDEFEEGKLIRSQHAANTPDNQRNTPTR
ncbi:lysophospholipid acyltransferase family protein [bacterium]|nr:lysophospholipid acyltransferase family protein [candidate division CSSED10-310 bacterium]